MSHEQFNDNCPRCRPVLIDPTTGKPLLTNDPAMQAVDRIWAATTREQRQRFHAFCCLNEHTPENMEVMQFIGDELRKIMK